MNSLDAVRDGLALLLTWGLAGVLLGYCVVPEQLDFPTRLRLSLALAVPATVLVIALALPFGLLGAPTFLGGGVVLAGVAVVRLRHRLGTLRDLRGAIGSCLSGLSGRGYLLTLAIAVVAWLAVLRPQLAARRSDGLPLGATVWYYWRLVRMVLSEGGVPASIVEWGVPRPFPTEYLGATVHAAVTSALAGGADLALLERYRFLMVGLGLLAAQALWRHWLPLWWSWVAALVTLTTERLSSKFTAYRPETFGLLLVIWSAWLLDEALERRSPSWAALAGLVSAPAYLAHAEIWLLTGPLWLGMVASRLALYAWHRCTASRDGGKPSGNAGNAMFPSPRALVAATAAFAVMVGLVTAVTGNAGRIGELVGVVEKEAVPQDVSGPDPTWRLNASLYRPSAIRRDPPPFCENFLIVGATSTPFDGTNLRRPVTQVGLGAALILLFAVSRWLPGIVLAGTLVWSAYALGLYAGSSTICAIYDTYVPERAGPSRLMPYYVLSLVWLVTALAWAAATFLTMLVHRLLPDNIRLAPPRSVATTLVSGLLLLALTPISRGAVTDEEGGLALSAYQAFDWMRSNLSEDGIVLANGYTAGSIGAASGLSSWLDGRVPYLESSQWREEATSRTLNARRYFQDPQRQSRLLPDEVDYVLVGAPGVVLGGSRFATDMAALKHSPQLRMIRTFGGNQVFLYEVVRDGAGGAQDRMACL